MRILLLGRRGLDHAIAGDVLRGAGHEVAACFATAEPWACSALNGPCPLDTHTDVVVAARQPGPERYDSQGTVCARRRRVPLVVIGAQRDDPIRAVASAVVDQPGEDLVGTCVELAAGPSPGHTAAARRALADRILPSEAVEVTVSRTAEGLHVSLATSEPDTTHTRALVERVRSALTSFDPSARRIVVTVHHPEPA